jgi:hypothetical protein
MPRWPDTLSGFFAWARAVAMLPLVRNAFASVDVNCAANEIVATGL